MGSASGPESVVSAGSTLRQVPSAGNSWKASMANSEWDFEAGAPSCCRSSQWPQVHLNLRHRVKVDSSVFVLFISAPQTGHTIDIVVAFMIGVGCTGRATVWSS